VATLNEVRGSGVRFTLPYLFRFSGLWLVVTILAMVLFGITSYLVASPRLEGEARSHLAVVLALQTAFLIAAVIALAVFTTHRLAGPYIALQRAFQEVRDGKLDRPLRFRSTDIHLGELEASFNEMLAALRGRSQGPGGPAGGA
jgi:nitrogen fixation/metabolism regulation signal transduction histidine kinase